MPDVIIIGGGAAGIALALQLPENTSIALFTKDNTKQCSTYFAQGGISAVLDENDSFELHDADTQNAGSGLCDPATVKMVAQSGPSIIDWLADLGMPFTKNEPDSNQNDSNGFP